MGVRDLLTKQFKLTSAILNWREPGLFRVRLRNDLVIRLLVILGAWLGSTGLLLLLFAFNADPPGPSLAFGLGLIGAGIGFILVLGRSDQVSGACWIYEDKVTWQSTSAGLIGIQGNLAEWDYDAIDRCVIIPSKYTGRSFSVMLITADGERSMIGIPKRINVKQITNLLSKKDVDVSMAKTVPAAYTSGIAMPIGVAVSVVGVAVLSAGLLIGPNDHGRNQREAVGLGDPDFDFIPGPVAQPEVPVSDQDHSSLPARPVSPPESASSQSTDLAVPFGFGPGPDIMPPHSRLTNPLQPQHGDSAAGASVSPSSGPVVTNGQGSDSELLGGKGGGPFRNVSPAGKPVVAIQYAIGQWAGKDRIGRLVPLFEPVPAVPGQQLVVARDGYALGAMQVDAGDLVDAIRFVFMRITPDGSLNENESYTSDWIGHPDENNIRTITGQGVPVIGFYGRGAAVIDAVGLVFGRPAP